MKEEIKLREALAVIPTKVLDELRVKEFNVRTVTTDGELSVSCYPFPGIYIEVYLKSDDATKESDIRNTIERAIGETVSCTCSPEMSGCPKAVYRVDFEMKGIA